MQQKFFNFSLLVSNHDLHCHCSFFQDILDNQAVSDPVFYALVTLYALMIVGSVLGNIMVITAVLKSPNMRKVR